MPVRLPLALRAYRFVSRAATPLMPWLLAERLDRGREHPTRLAERRGEASLPRPDGPLVWVHGASVGEMLAVAPLIERIKARDISVLVTTGTVTSAALADQRLPAGVLHQFVPLDAPKFVNRFLDHWHPDMALFVESDLWPNLILTSSERKIPLIVVNGRVSERSFGRWRLASGTIAALLDRFDLCLAQSPDNAQRFSRLGAHRVTSTGNLKLDVPAPPADVPTLNRFRALIGLRDVVAAASTHPGEEAAVITAHRRLRAKIPTLLTVIAPRHPARGESIAEIGKVAGLSIALRSRGELPKRDVDVYIADTVGELGLVYRIAPIVFMGGSLATHGGQNPIEAIRLGAAVLHGPCVWNFAEIYSTLDKAHGAELVLDEEALTAHLAAWLRDPAARAAVVTAATETMDKLGGALERTLAALDPYLMQLRLNGRATAAG
ncbi:MAG: 3-deoxy-D-manno-octulosonic acid transferase [Xanthobacteraceae bacterium]